MKQIRENPKAKKERSEYPFPSLQQQKKFKKKNYNNNI